MAEKFHRTVSSNLSTNYRQRDARRRRRYVLGHYYLAIRIREKNFHPNYVLSDPTTFTVTVSFAKTSTSVEFFARYRRPCFWQLIDAI